MTSMHALERIIERFPDMREQVESALARAEARYTKRTGAIRLAVLPEGHRGALNADVYDREQSNGDTIWAIIKDGNCVTCMLRRSEPCGACVRTRRGQQCIHRQPSTREAFRVDYVVTSV